MKFATVNAIDNYLLIMHVSLKIEILTLTIQPYLRIINTYPIHGNEFRFVRYLYTPISFVLKPLKGGGILFIPINLNSKLPKTP